MKAVLLMNQEVKNLILAGEFKKAYDQMVPFNLNELSDFLIIAAFDFGSITFYGFVNYLILLNESAALHELAATIMAQPLCYIEGAYALAFFHAQKLLELEPDDIKNKEFLLFFHIIPDKVLGKEEAIEIAKDILKVESDNKAAREIVQRYNLEI